MATRWQPLMVRLTAWGLRRGITVDRMTVLLDRRFRHRTPQWRADVIAGALAVNRSRLMAGISA